MQAQHYTSVAMRTPEQTHTHIQHTCMVLHIISHCVEGFELHVQCFTILIQGLIIRVNGEICQNWTLVKDTRCRVLLFVAEYFTLTCTFVQVI